MMLGTQGYAIREARFLTVRREFLLAPKGRNSSSAALPAIKSVPLVRLHRRRRRSGQEIGERSPARVVVVSCAAPATAAPAASGKGAGKSTVTATISVQTEVESLLANIGIGRGLDDISDLLGKSIQVELVSSELNPENGKEKESIKAWAHKGKKGDGVQKYEAKLEVEGGFGEVGAVLITNVHHSEMYFKEIELRGLAEGDVHISCNSWVHAQKDSPQKRVFFTDKLADMFTKPLPHHRLRALSHNLGLRYNLRSRLKGDVNAQAAGSYSCPPHEDHANPTNEEDHDKFSIDINGHPWQL